jgi:hypothetical protein
MSSPRPASTRGAATRGLVRQLGSHRRLLTDLSAEPAPRSGGGRLDAIIVPTSRPASNLFALAALAVALGARLVVLGSGKAGIEQVRQRIGKFPGVRGLVVGFDETYHHPDFPARTSTAKFRDASGGRTSDLSAKRNFGLLLARLCGWSKVVFIDDDITVSSAAIARLTAQLDTHQIAGMVCRDFPDNSVVCHARRLAQLPQDTFVTGAVMGVNCNDLPLPFFPDIYNEDWFSFAGAAAEHRLAKSGEARQAEYYPFGSAQRARHEEFGDVLAEGLYTLFEINGPGRLGWRLKDAQQQQYWQNFIQERRNVLAETTEKLTSFLGRGNCSDDVPAAIVALGVAAEQLKLITPELCVEFIRAWQGDLEEWTGMCPHFNSVGRYAEALDWLKMGSWQPLPDFGSLAGNDQG